MIRASRPPGLSADEELLTAARTLVLPSLIDFVRTPEGSVPSRERFHWQQLAAYFIDPTKALIGFD